MYDNPDDDDYRDRDQATPKQLKFLKKLGVTHAPNISLDDASDLISAAIEKRDRRKNWSLGCLLMIFSLLVFSVFAVLVYIGLSGSLNH